MTGVDDKSGADPASYNTTPGTSGHNSSHHTAPHQATSDGAANNLFTKGTAQNHQFPHAELSARGT